MPDNVAHNNLTLRPAHVGDLPALLALEAQFPGDRMSARQFRRHLRSATARVQVALCDEMLIGASLLFFRSGSRCARLYSLVVAASARGHGIGARLLADAEHGARGRGCQRLRLEVRVDNAAAIALYQRAGYLCFGEVPGYYHDGVAALRMHRDLQVSAAVLPVTA